MFWREFEWTAKTMLTIVFSTFLMEITEFYINNVIKTHFMPQKFTLIRNSYANRFLFEDQYFN